MRITSLQELAPLLSRLPEQKRRAIVEAFRDAGERSARAMNAALDAEEVRRNSKRSEMSPEPTKRGSKYGNRIVEDGGELFHSVGEWRRCLELRALERAGFVSELERQVEYPIAVAGVYVCSWFADFRYKQNGATVVEDFKGFRTDVYKLKKKFVEAIYKFRILETGTRKKAPEKKREKWITYTATKRTRTRKP
jgi:hypothetical protein